MGNSAAAAARVIDLRPGDVVLESTDPDHPDRMKPLKNDPARGWWDHDELARRLRKLQGKPVKLEVARAQAQGKGKQTVELAPEGFQFGDWIVACTDPELAGWQSAVPPQEYDPFKVSDVPPDPRHPEESSGSGVFRDPFEFQLRMHKLAGKPVLIRVRRGNDEVTLFVPPAFHRRLGAHMQMGRVTAIRRHLKDAWEKLSPEEKEKRIAVGDVIDGVLLKGDKGQELLKLTSSQIDPVRLPSQLAAVARRHPGKKTVTLTVIRPNSDPSKKIKTLEPMEWDQGWDFVDEPPRNDPRAPLAVSQLGIAYLVNSQIVRIDPGTPAARAERRTSFFPLDLRGGGEALLPGDKIIEIRWRKRVKGQEEPGWAPWIELTSDSGKEPPYDMWAYTDWALQFLEFNEVELRVRRDSTGDVPFRLATFGVTLEEDPTWPEADRGLQLTPDNALHKADGLGEALQYGVQETWRFINNIYLGLSRVVSGRVSTKTFGGPIEIVSTTFNLASEDFYAFVLFMGVLSINLAVVNFLPIPLLDGGHMVFLIYEKLRGKPASENVRAIAAYIGLAMLLALMVYVCFLDGKRRGWW
jgi:regulator of sigma E protease